MYKNLLVRSRGDGWEVFDLEAGAAVKFDDRGGAKRHAEAIAREHGGAIYFYDCTGRLESSTAFPART